MTRRDDAPPAYPRGRRIRLDRRTGILRDPRGTLRILGGDPVSLVTPVQSVAARAIGGGFRVDDSVSASLARALTDRGMAHPVVTGGPPRHLSWVTVVIPVRDDAAGVAGLLDSLAPLKRSEVRP